MYAIIKTGGKQYRVEEAMRLRVEAISAEIGSVIAFDQVLALGAGSELRTGDPFLKGATVKAEVIEQGREKKINVVKFRRRKDSMNRKGHRQNCTTVLIKEIDAAEPLAEKTAAAEVPVEGAL